MSMASSESVPAAVTLARLKVSPPQVAYDVLRDMSLEAKTSDRYGFATTDTDALEQALFSRNVPLINLALAKFGRSAKVVSGLFRQAVTLSDDVDVVHGIRVGCLSNVLEPLQPYFGSPGGLQLDELAEVLRNGSTDECTALLQNPAAGHVLARLYIGHAPFDDLPPERLVELVQMSIGNARINLDDSSVDGPDMLAWDIWKGIFHMVLSAPLDARWLNVLQSMLTRINPLLVHSLAESDVMTAISRWEALRITNSFKETNEEREGYYTELSLVDEFRCMVAAIFGRWIENGVSEFKFAGSPASTDVALRCAYYGNASAKTLAGPEWDAAVAKDGSTFTFAALFNDYVLLDKSLRASLEDRMNGQQHHMYQARCKQLSEHYKWFDPRPVLDMIEPAENDNATQAEAAVVASLARVEGELQAIKLKTSTLSTPPTWMLAAILVLLVYIAFR